MLVARRSSEDIQQRQRDLSRVVFCLDFTTGGNARGARCHFPFMYRAKFYNSCMYGNATNLWCATTNSYDADKKWGYCRVDNG